MKHNFGRQGVEVWGAQIDEEKKPELSLQSGGGHDNIVMKSLPNKVNRYTIPVSELTKQIFCRQKKISRLCQLQKVNCKGFAPPNHFLNKFQTSISRIKMYYGSNAR